MDIYIGKKLKPKDHIRDWDDEEAEIIGFNNKTKKWHILVAGNFSAWLTEERIEKDFDTVEVRDKPKGPPNKKVDGFEGELNLVPFVILAMLLLVLRCVGG